MARSTYRHGGVNVQRHFGFDVKEERAAEVQRGEPWTFRRLRTNAEEWSSPMGAVDRFYRAACQAGAIRSCSCARTTGSHGCASSEEILPHLLQCLDVLFDANDAS